MHLFMDCPTKLTIIIILQLLKKIIFLLSIKMEFKKICKLDVLSNILPLDAIVEL